MKTSATETELIDRYLNHQLPQDEYLLFEAQMLLNAELQDKTHWQQKTLELVQLRGRKQLKAHIKQAEALWFNQAEYNTVRQKVFKLFDL